MSDSNLVDQEIEKFLAGFGASNIEDDGKDDQRPEEQVNNHHDHQNNDRNIRTKSIPDLKDLTFVRLIDPIHIPSYLVKQIKDRLYSVDKFYEYQKIACLYMTNDGLVLNPNNFLYALINEKMRQVKGFVCMAIDTLTNSLVINTISIDKEYWQKGNALELINEKANKMMKDLSLSRIVWVTYNSRFCENKGYKRSRESIMTYEE
ncbi:MAG: hypothetical protein V4509_01895 [Patescibacteria group bacterium]